MPRRKRKLSDTPRAVAEETETLEEYAAYVEQLSPEVYTAETILWQLKNTRSVLSFRKMNHSIGCTHSESRACHIMGDLKLWNEFLWIIHLELKEVVPKKLGIVHLLGCNWRMATEDQKCHAFILLHWLLQKHRCIEVLDLKETPFGTDLCLLGDALRCNVGIRRLKMSHFDEVPKRFVAALASISSLQELELRDVSLTRHALNELPLAVRAMPSLTSLRVDMRRLNPRITSLLLDALEECRATALHVPGWCLNNGTVFAEFLARNTSLRELTIDGITTEMERTNEVLALFGALKTNKVLEKLCLPYCSLEPSESIFLAEVMAENCSLRVLQVEASSRHEPNSDAFVQLIQSNSGLWEIEIRGLFPVSELAGCIRTNTTLKKLGLRCAYLNVEDTEAFLDGVASNRQLELVTLGNVFEVVPGVFHQLLERKGLEKRVHYDCYTSEPPIHTSNKRSNARLKRVFFESRQEPVIEVVHCLYSKLACPHQFVEVSIRLDNLDYVSAGLLARFLSSTEVLESLYLTFYADESPMRVLLEGLLLNKSISSLGFEDCRFTNEDATLLGTLVKESSTMQELTLMSPDYSTSCAVLSELSSSLVNSFLLLSLRTNEYLDLGHYMFQIKDILRRNGSMLLDAVQFAMGSCTKQLAEAFERHVEGKLLVQKLQEVAGETEFEARERIKTRLRYLRYNFLTITGVVKDSVICKQSRQQQTLLSHIGFDNLLRVVSYLKVRDIVDAPVAGSSRAPGSRMQLRRRRRAQP